MLLEGGEACAHCVDADVRCAQVLPSLRLARPLAGSAFSCIYLRLDAKYVGVGASLANVAAEPLDGLLHPVVRSSQREPAIGEACSTAQHGVCTATCPDGDGAAHGEGVEPCFSDGMILAFVGDDFLTP